MLVCFCQKSENEFGIVIDCLHGWIMWMSWWKGNLPGNAEATRSRFSSPLDVKKESLASF